MVTGRTYPGFALVLALGAAGGTLFTWFGLPLSWVLGAITASGLASILSLPVCGSARTQPPMSALSGTMFGSQFGPHTLDSAAI